MESLLTFHNIIMRCVSFMHSCASAGRLYHTNSKGPHQNIALHRHSSPSGLKPPQNKLVTSVLESLLRTQYLPILLFVRIQHLVIKKTRLPNTATINTSNRMRSIPPSFSSWLALRVWSRSRSILSFLFNWILSVRQLFCTTTAQELLYRHGDSHLNHLTW